jgi:hypothetical protein
VGHGRPVGGAGQIGRRDQADAGGGGRRKEAAAGNAKRLAGNFDRHESLFSVHAQGEEKT